MSFYVLSILGNFDETFLFIDPKKDPCSEDDFVNALEKAGYHDFANFALTFTWRVFEEELEPDSPLGELFGDPTPHHSTGEILVAAVKGEIEGTDEYVSFENE